MTDDHRPSFTRGVFAGEIPADELRLTIRNSLSQNPLLASAYVALAEAYRRANVIDAGLQSVINSDIAEVTAPRFAKNPRPYARTERRSVPVTYPAARSLRSERCNRLSPHPWAY